LNFVKSTSKSDLLPDKQYVDPKSIAMGNESVSKSTPSGMTLTKDAASALITKDRLVKQSAILSLPPFCRVFQVTMELVLQVHHGNIWEKTNVIGSACDDFMSEKLQGLSSFCKSNLHIPIPCQQTSGHHGSKPPTRQKVSPATSIFW
jgi:hypothetical protein